MTAKAFKAVEKAYHQYVCSRQCLVPGCTGTCGASGAHHLRGRNLGGGVGLKPPELTRIPLCFRHHHEIHQIGIDSFEKKHGLNLTLELIKCLQGFIYYKATDEEAAGSW